MARSIVRTLLIAGAATALTAGIGACSCSVTSKHAVSKSDVAGQITAKMTDAPATSPSR